MYYLLLYKDGYLKLLYLSKTYYYILYIKLAILLFIFKLRYVIFIYNSIILLFYNYFNTFLITF